MLKRIIRLRRSVKLYLRSRVSIDWAFGVIETLLRPHQDNLRAVLRHLKHLIIRAILLKAGDEWGVQGGPKRNSYALCGLDFWVSGKVYKTFFRNTFHLERRWRSLFSYPSLGSVGKPQAPECDRSRNNWSPIAFSSTDHAVRGQGSRPSTGQFFCRDIWCCSWIFSSASHAWCHTPYSRILGSREYSICTTCTCSNHRNCRRYRWDSRLSTLQRLRSSTCGTRSRRDSESVAGSEHGTTPDRRYKIHASAP